MSEITKQLRPGEPCPETDCNGTLSFDEGDAGSYMEPATSPVLFCETCGCDVDSDTIDWDYLNAIHNGEIPEPRLTEDETSLRRDISANLYDAYKRAIEAINPVSPEDYFEHAPDGPFTWEDSEAGDWIPWDCGEKDCDQQWHMTAYAENIGRRTDGTRYIEFKSVDQDGNWDYENGWDEADGDTPETWDTNECGTEAARRSIDHFYHWGRYWIDAAATGKDPLDQITRRQTAETWVAFCLEAAADNLGYLLKIDDYPLIKEVTKDSEAPLPATALKILALSGMDENKATAEIRGIIADRKNTGPDQ